jgi:hypothetical protein
MTSIVQLVVNAELALLIMISSVVTQEEHGLVIMMIGSTSQREISEHARNWTHEKMCQLTTGNVNLFEVSFILFTICN